MLRSLRTQLLERHVRCGRRALTVCGASTGVGISFMAANLAVAFSRAGANTLLIDANMRHPAVQRFIIPDRPVAGLSQSLTLGGESLEGAICNGVSGNLSVLYSRSEEHTSELQSLMRISYAVFCLKKKQP